MMAEERKFVLTTISTDLWMKFRASALQDGKPACRKLEELIKKHLNQEKREERDD